jgi:glycerophosphoryl diester phosphodiesterase
MIKSLSSFCTLVVLSCSSTTAFAPLTSNVKSPSSLLTLQSSSSYHPPPNSTDAIMMTSSRTTNTAAFLARANQAPPADPSILWGTPAFVLQAPTKSLLDTHEKKDGLQWVPPSKSLRTRLNLPAASSATTAFTTPRIVGHRGSLYEELENTRPAFLKCAGICDAVELDVFLLKDDTIVVFHGSGTDQNPGLLKDYCTNSNAGYTTTSILDLTYAETQQLTFNPHFAELAAPDDRVRQGKIPTLDQVLRDLQPTGMEVKIELKGPSTARPVVELVDRLHMADRVSFSSFNHQEIATVRQMRPQTNPDGSYVYRTGALFDKVPANFVQQALKVQASEVHLRYDACTTDRINAIHRAGLGSMAWFRGPIGMQSDVANKYWDIGNEDAACYQTVMDTGVQQLCVNKPRVLYEYLQSSTRPRVGSVLAP